MARLIGPLANATPQMCKGVVFAMEPLYRALKEFALDKTRRLSKTLQKQTVFLVSEPETLHLEHPVSPKVFWRRIEISVSKVVWHYMISHLPWLCWLLGSPSPNSQARTLHNQIGADHWFSEFKDAIASRRMQRIKVSSKSFVPLRPFLKYLNCCQRVSAALDRPWTHCSAHRLGNLLQQRWIKKLKKRKKIEKHN